MWQVTGCIYLELEDKKLAEALVKALDVESRNPPDPERGKTSVSVSDGNVKICFEARDLAAARALLNAYLGLAAASLDTLARSEGV
ncbi:MAG TPA: hypothetical protein EYH26_00610 [Pyrodictium sp.]|nr:hypothetical protein [Pyrodictium sp.]